MGTRCNITFEGSKVVLFQHWDGYPDGDNGVLFDEPAVDALAAALTRMARLRVDSTQIAAGAQRFARERHVDALRALIDNTLAAPAGTRW